MRERAYYRATYRLGRKGVGLAYLFRRCSPLTLVNMSMRSKQILTIVYVTEKQVYTGLCDTPTGLRELETSLNRFTWEKTSLYDSLSVNGNLC